MSVGEKVFGCLVLPVFVPLILPLVAIYMNWGHDIWGTIAPAWPGGAYAFAATVGVKKAENADSPEPAVS